jgi:hypothetical protein
MWWVYNIYIQKFKILENLHTIMYSVWALLFIQVKVSYFLHSHWFSTCKKLIVIWNGKNENVSVVPVWSEKWENFFNVYIYVFVIKYKMHVYHICIWINAKCLSTFGAQRSLAKHVYVTSFYFCASAFYFLSQTMSFRFLTNSDRSRFEIVSMKFLIFSLKIGRKERGHANQLKWKFWLLIHFFFSFK